MINAHSGITVKVRRSDDQSILGMRIFCFYMGPLFMYDWVISSLVVAEVDHSDAEVQFGSNAGWGPITPPMAVVVLNSA